MLSGGNIMIKRKKMMKNKGRSHITIATVIHIDPSRVNFYKIKL